MEKQKQECVFCVRIRSTTTRCLDSENGICITCKEGFFLDFDNKCNDIEHCKYSVPSYPSYSCKECDEGYYFDQWKKKCELEKDSKFENCLRTN